MRKHRLHLLVLALMLSLAVVAAGCGGDDDEEGAGGRGRRDRRGGSGLRRHLGHEHVVGAGAEVVRGGHRRLHGAEPRRRRHLRLGGRRASDRSLDGSGGWEPPDVAVVPQPGLVQQYVERGALQPIDFAQDTIAENFAESVIEVGTFEDQLYAVLFKASNKSTYWYNVQAFEDAGVEATEDWEEFLANAETIKASGLPAYSIGGAEGWTLTDLFENIYLRTAGADMYDQLSPRDPLDRSVRQGRADRDGQDRRRHRQHRRRDARSPPVRLHHLGEQRVHRRSRRARW